MSAERLLEFAALMKTARSAESSLAIARAATFDVDISTQELVELASIHRRRWGLTCTATADSEAMAFVRRQAVTVRPPHGARPWTASMTLRRRGLDEHYELIEGQGTTPQEAVSACADRRMDLIAKGVCHA